ncbi:MAG TPA: sterol desaturase family protein [Alphaproteobacteria bacterium]
MGYIDEVMRAQLEPLTYATFFGALALFGALETVMARSRAGLDRRRRWPANGALTLLNILVLGAVPVSAIAVADLAAARGWGAMNVLPLAPVVALALGIALRSLISYVIHVAMHRMPLLWRVHRVHHTDTAMDVTTTVRFHPLEFVISVPLVFLGVIALGISPAALIVYELFDAAMAIFTHANIRLPALVDRALRLVLVTPDMHRVHHSAWQPETDSNYGATFSWWDRLFGTYRTPEAAALPTMALGLEPWRDRRTTAVRWLLALPFDRPAPRAAAGPAR